MEGTYLEEQRRKIAVARKRNIIGVVLVLAIAAIVYLIFTVVLPRGEINAVRNTLHQPTNMSFGDILEGYNSRTRWSRFTSAEFMRVVEFTGTTRGGDSVLIQFSDRYGIHDGEWVLVYMALNGRSISTMEMANWFMNAAHFAGGSRSSSQPGTPAQNVEAPQPDINLAVTFEANTPSPTIGDMEAAISLIEQRLVANGILVANIEHERNLINVEISLGSQIDSNRIIYEIGRRGQLTFSNENGDVLLTGSDVARVSAVSDSGNYLVELEFTEHGRTAFADATRDNIGRAILIQLDDELLAAPTVQTIISDGRAVIHGNFTREAADAVVSTIRAGALPFALSVVSVDGNSAEGSGSANAIASNTGFQVIFEVSGNPSTTEMSQIAEMLHQRLDALGISQRNIYQSGINNFIIMAYGTFGDIEALINQMQDESAALLVVALNLFAELASPALDNFQGGDIFTFEMGRDIPSAELQAISDFVENITSQTPVSVISYTGGSVGVITQPFDSEQRSMFINAFLDEFNIAIYSVSYSNIRRVS